MIKPAAALAVLLLSACATERPTARPNVGVRPATADQVATCEYLDDVSSVSGRYGVFAGSALDDTRAQVLAKAQQRGATHLVWEPPVLVYGSTTSRGKAYRCP